MALIVQKFGGTSVGTIERIKNVAQRVKRTRDAGHDVVVVVSAMAGETNRLVKLAYDIDPDPISREYDVLLASGEQVSIALVAMALNDLGAPARSLLGHQVDIRTDATFSRARIESIGASILRSCLERGEIPVVAGFQGIDREGNITTLGRGGSDTTGVALAAALQADVCEIYTDVDGIYTTDPNICPRAQKIARISYEEMLELASLGAKVLQTRSVEFGMKYRVPIHVRSSFDESEGSWVVPEDSTMEQVVVRAVTHDRNDARISVIGVQDQPGVAARIFEALSQAEIVVDMIIQNSSQDLARTDVTFTVPKANANDAIAHMRKIADELGAKEVKADRNISKVSVVGVGMRSHSGVAAKMFKTLSAAGVNIQMIATSEIKISVVIDDAYTELAVRLLHTAFGLDA
ncbi:MAG: aspartate kinase [Deltaproteobacteria bacterium]|nr:aspartate kinase [Deltaproteobacteria bacterium]